MVGYVHVYTGDGKGKTTAALGLALRAAGAGLHTFIGQFVKGNESSELRVIRKLSDLIELRPFGRECFVAPGGFPADRQAARAGMAAAREALQSSRYSMVILDEINVAVQLGLITVDDVLALIDERPRNVELVLTGRGADRRVIDRADLVTEMHEVKHYYRQGVLARVGIER